jgi:hypothetical protein
MFEVPNTFARDADGNVITRNDFDPRPKLYCFATGAWEGDDLRRWSVDEMVSELAQWCRDRNIDSVVSDQRENAALESMFKRHRMYFKSYAWTNESKDAAVTTLRRMLKERRLWITPDDRLQQEMLSYGYKLSPGGKFVYAGRFGNDDRISTLITFCHALNDNFGEYPNVRYVADGR